MVGFVSFDASAMVVTQFTDKNQWQAAASGSVTIEDFTNEADGSFTNRNFGDFNAELINPYTFWEPKIFEHVTHGKVLALQARDEGSRLKLTFDSDLTAIGFDWVNLDSNDNIELVVSAVPYNFGASNNSGFFGLVVTGGTLNEFAFGDSVGGGGELGGALLDNYHYVFVPEPSLGLLLCISLVGLAGAGVVQKIKKNQERCEKSTA